MAFSARDHLTTAAPAVGAPFGESSSTVLRAEGVGVVLGRRHILSDVTFSVAAGEVIAMLGANGSGKSTLVRAALGIIPTSAGSFALFGQPKGTSTPWARIGYVPQLLPASTGIPTTACEVVRAGALAPGRLRGASKREAVAALDIMGLGDRATQPVQQMSGGQQQRVLIARALIRKPDLLLLDEPTSGIDLDTVTTFVHTIDAMRKTGTTVIVVLHETEAFASLLDRAIVLRRGRVIYDGPPPSARGEHAGPGHIHAHGHDHGKPVHPANRLGLEFGDPR